MNYLKLASLLLIQYTSAVPARLSDDTIAATDDLLGSLGIDLKKSSQMAAKQCFDLSMNSFDCMTKQAMTLSGKELVAFYDESAAAAVDVAKSGLESITSKRPIMMKLQAQCQNEIKRATNRIEERMQIYANEVMNTLGNKLGSIDFGKTLESIWG